MDIDEANYPESQWEIAQGELFFKLRKENVDRYRRQAKYLIKLKEIDCTLGKLSIHYQLSRVGCAHQIILHSEDQADSTTFIPSQGWTRLGWKKSHKLANLPDFFAITEATALLYASGHE